MKNNFLKLLFVLSLVFSVSTRGFSQAEPNVGRYVPQPIPPSPNASSLGKYGDVPVGLYNGIPSVNVPIWQVNEGDLSLPISLSYYASGIKIEQDASWVGLGWSLNAGGVITRTVRGKPDEDSYLNRSYPKIPNQLLNPQNTQATACEKWEATKYAYLVGLGSYDSEPDIFYFNFNGFSGKFVFDQDGGIHTIPYQKIQIVRLNDIDWEVTTEDGTKYKFGGQGNYENSINYSVVYPFYDWGVTNKNKTRLYECPSAWYLKEIESTGGRKITFEYDSENYQTTSGISQNFYFDVMHANNSLTPSNSSSLSEISGVRLKRINFSNGSVEFVANKVREDLYYYLGNSPKALEKIVIKNNAQVPLKVFSLVTDYFRATVPTPSYQSKRLKLLSMTEFSGDETKQLPPYTFQYDEVNSLPSKISSSQDHWGFFNGKENKDMYGHPLLIPTVSKNFKNAAIIRMLWRVPGYDCINCPIVECHDPLSSMCLGYDMGVKNFEFIGANRDYDFNYAKSGILTKISYPTGGYNSFEYEPHDFELPDYKYKTGSAGIEVQASCYGPNNPSIHEGDKCYYQKTITPNDFIPADVRANNAKVPFDFTFSFNLDGNDNRCCKCGDPYVYFKDVTLNKILVDAYGFARLKTIDPSISIQLTDGTASMTQSGDAWHFTGVSLDPSHTYEIYARTIDCPQYKCEEFPDCPQRSPRMEAFINAGFNYSTNEVQVYNGLLGGLRIKRIIASPSLNEVPLVRNFSYRINSSGDKISSGIILSTPEYTDKFIGIFENGTTVAPTTFSGRYLNIHSMNSEILMLTSGAKFELGQTAGSMMGYREVQEIQCNGLDCSGTPQGKKISNFIAADIYKDKQSKTFGLVFFSGANMTCPSGNISPLTESYLGYAIPSEIDDNKHYYPYPPSTLNMDWKRGLIAKETYYSADGKIRRTEDYSYNADSDPNNRFIIPAVKISALPNGDDVSHNLYYGRYDILSAWNYLSERKTTDYDASGNKIENTITYHYDNPTHAQISRIDRSTSNINEKAITEYKYPADFSDVQSDNLTKEMKGPKFMHNVILQVNNKKEISGQKYILGSKITKFDYFSNGSTGNFVKLKEIANLENKEKVLESNVVEYPPYYPINNYDQKFKRRISYVYDTKGNLIESKKEDDINKLYIYDYNLSYPIAEVSNGIDVNSIAYTSFEADGTGNWGFNGGSFTSSYALSGDRGYTLTSANSITKSGLNSANSYVVSYWSRNGSLAINGSPGLIKGNRNGWTYYEHLISNSSSLLLSGNATIDELRLFPVGAVMTTYTYRPLVGITSQTDAKGQTTYYEYDEFQRLKSVKDQNGNILKNTIYHHRP